MVLRSILALVMTLSVTCAFAEVTTIPLPELTGDYEARWDVSPAFGETERQTIIVLPPELEHIEGLRLVLSGTWTDGRQICGGFPGDILPFRAGLSMMLRYSESHLETFQAGISPPEGVFENLDDAFAFSGLGEPQPFDRLLGADVVVSLGCSGATWCSVYLDAYGWLTDVHLEITGTVPTTGTTWGTLKALFR